VSLDTLKFFNEIMLLTKFGSGQLPFLGSRIPYRTNRL
jgi:hypothetical protein